ncbi:hypothetical protein NQZ68_026141 [Dissostichus eleginoides]|nr:hypothetical protein NQZ68_026141 [Dissostichus eleginoides]
MTHSSVLPLLLLLGTCSAYTYRNVALRGKASQSLRNQGHPGDADNAIDGNRDSNYLAGSCTATNAQTNPWWRVDLLESYIVTSIIITNRADCCAERLDGAEVHIGNSLQDNGAANPVVGVISHIPAGRSLKITFTKLVEGRYVTVALLGSGRLLTLCEVEVYGYRAPTDSVPQRLNGAEIRIGDSLEKNGNNNPRCAVISSIPAGFTETFQCNRMDGRYVNIVIPGRNEYLTLCEVEVYGSRLD